MTSRGASIRHLLRAAAALILLIIIVLGVTRLLGMWQIYRIPSDNMAPTYQAGDHLVSRKFSPDTHHLDRGLVVIYDAAGIRTADQHDLKGTFIQRIVGLAGDTVTIDNDLIRVNGHLVSRNGKYGLAPLVMPGRSGLPFPVIVPENHVFVMGDNFDNSVDSRYFGSISVDRIAQIPFHHIPGAATPKK